PRRGRRAAVRRGRQPSQGGIQGRVRLRGDQRLVGALDRVQRREEAQGIPGQGLREPGGGWRRPPHLPGADPGQPQPDGRALAGHQVPRHPRTPLTAARQTKGALREDRALFFAPVFLLAVALMLALPTIAAEAECRPAAPTTSYLACVGATSVAIGAAQTTRPSRQPPQSPVTLASRSQNFVEIDRRRLHTDRSL